MKTRNMRKKNKTRKIKGGKITKINDIWTIDPETVESNPTVMKYRTLEVDVLNVLAKNSSSNNSNIVLEHETTIEDNYKKLCKDKDSFKELKKIKELIKNIIRFRHEEAIDRLKPNETTEERIIREKHEHRLHLWMKKYTIIKKLLNEVRLSLHEPPEIEDNKHLTTRLAFIESNLASIDEEFPKIIKKSIELQEQFGFLPESIKLQVDKLNELKILLNDFLFKFESLPDIDKTTTFYKELSSVIDSLPTLIEFSVLLNDFIEQKRLEYELSRHILLIRQAKIIEFIQQDNIPEDVEIEEIESELPLSVESELHKKPSKKLETKDAEAELQTAIRTVEIEKETLLKMEIPTIKISHEDLTSDTATLAKFDALKTVLIKTADKLKQLNADVNELKKIILPEIIDKVYVLYSEMKQNPSTENQKELETLINDMKKEIHESDVDKLYKLIANIYSYTIFFEKKNKEYTKDIQEVRIIMAKLESNSGSNPKLEKIIDIEKSEIQLQNKLELASKEPNKEKKMGQYKELLQQLNSIRDKLSTKIEQTSLEYEESLSKNPKLNTDIQAMSKYIHYREYLRETYILEKPFRLLSTIYGAKLILQNPNTEVPNISNAELIDRIFSMTGKTYTSKKDIDTVKLSMELLRQTKPELDSAIDKIKQKLKKTLTTKEFDKIEENILIIRLIKSRINKITEIMKKYKSEYDSFSGGYKKKKTKKKFNLTLITHKFR